MVDGAASEWISIVSGCHREVCWVLFFLSYITLKCLGWLAEQLLAADRPVAVYLNRDLARIQVWCNHWCMILNPNKTRALIVNRSRTVNPPHDDLICLGFLSELVPTSTSSA